MASAVSIAPEPVSVPISEPSEVQRHAGQGRGPRKGPRGGRRGGARGGRHRNDSGGRAFGQAPHELGTESARAGAQKPTASSAPVADADGPDEGDSEVCFICAAPVVHQSVAPCNHRSCHICALRLRALYKTRACAHCRTEARHVIFTDDADKQYADFGETDFAQVDDVLGIKYQKKEIYDDTVLLLRYNCPDPSCDIACFGWPDLHRHVRQIHHKMMCDLCTRNKKVFTHEHDLYTAPELRKHEKFGDDNPGAVDQSGFKGHPECGFCRKRFYGDDELYTHCREKHERCHLCDRRSSGRQPQYFVNYDALEVHFRKDHFLCFDQRCLDAKFVVFDSEMDLKAHQLQEHNNDLSRDARRDARRVDLAAFDYRAPRNSERNGRPGGRGRDPNAEPLPPTSAQPMRRDELAYQRQMAVQSAQSQRPRTFGGQLTQPANSQATTSAPAANASLTTAMATLNVQDRNADASQPAQTAPQTMQERARQDHHAAVMERASALLKNNVTKINDFRSRVSAYRNSNITATELIDTFFSLFDASPVDLGKLVKELADLYDDEAKRSDLLRAWNDWRAINEDYPSLPGPDGDLPSTSGVSGGGSRRILKLKSSTAQSSRSSVNREHAWGNAGTTPPATSRPGPGSNAPGPALGRGSSGLPWGVSKSSPRPAAATPVMAATAASTVAPLSNHRAMPPPRTEAFPALPAAAKPNVAMFGVHRGTVNWDTRAAPVISPWVGNSSGNAADVGGGADISGTDDASHATGKKKGKKKQTLYKFG